MAVLREKIVRFTCNTCMYGIHFVWREWGDEWAMGRGGGLSGLGEKLRGGGSIAGITFGHVAGRGGDMRVRRWRYFRVGADGTC